MGRKKQLPGTTMHPNSGDFTYTAPVSVCVTPKPHPASRFGQYLHEIDSIAYGMQEFMGMANFPASPAGRSIWKYFETFLK